MATVNVYIDGLNLYYGALRDSPYRWLDLLKLSRGLLKASDHVQRSRYFTAPVDHPTDPRRAAAAKEVYPRFRFHPQPDSALRVVRHPCQNHVARGWPGSD